MTFLDSLSPQSREELRNYIESTVEEILRRRRPERRWVSVREAAKLIGCTETALRRRISRGRVPIKRQGRSILVDLIELDRRLDAS